MTASGAFPDRITTPMVIDALRSARVDLAAYEAEQAGEDFDPGSIEVGEDEINYIRWYRERLYGRS